MKWIVPLVVTAMPANAESALEWLTTRSAPAIVAEAGTWTTPSGIAYAIDPLTLFGGDNPIADLPQTAATIVGFHPLDVTDRVSLMALIWSDQPVLCGDDVATIGVDTGLAAFVGPSDLPVLENYGAQWETLYAGPYAEQIDAFYPGPILIDLPGASGFPLSGSGWGDGGYPVATLKDAEGRVTALYTQFITAEGEDWLLPSPCADGTS
ncbi:hypothetical protein [Yoonia sp. BS5-3]|uniref:Uncharacterized protein n=1 Tax=Yoonia phaeophyticola TaxID=3137369 RepID=A0ABZ2V9K5_9RHOB